VALALAATPAAYSIILVHDAARALTPPDQIERVAAAVRSGQSAVVPVLPVADTIKQVDAEDAIVATVDRSALRAVQTPQGFRRDVLAAAHDGATDQHTDDAGLVERMGVRVHTVLGSDRALKITRPVDLVIAEALLRVP
jgi:2-C-methyl-D-erythritol 4-phosphate cytidylyltransferase